MISVVNATDIERLGGDIISARWCCARARQGVASAGSEFLDHLRHCAALFAESPRHARFEVQLEIARQATLCAEKCAGAGDWATAWKALDMIHNIGMLAHDADEWDDLFFLGSFVRPHLEFLPHPFAWVIGALADRLEQGLPIV